jgi:light-independent protochlorophyllide reductase subunit B
MGLEEHLLGMFRDDFEFGDDAGPSHLGHGAAKPVRHAARPGHAEATAAPVLPGSGQWRS